MKTVYLTSGPRGAGKSTYVSMVQKCSPKILVVDRDELFIREFGSYGFDPYSGMHHVAAELLKREIKRVVSNSDKDAKIILDAWNGFWNERKSYIRLLRDLGVESIVCWYFITPLSVCIEWFGQKNCIGFDASSVKWDYKLYHEQASDINYPEHEIYRVEDADDYDARFNMICRINPQQLSLPGVSLI